MVKQSNKNISLYISNNGSLLPEQMAERLFDSMVSIRGNNKETSNPAIKKNNRPHLGLGLYIARLICEFHQGSINATNHHNPQGVTIEITLPVNN